MTRELHILVLAYIKGALDGGMDNCTSGHYDDEYITMIHIHFGHAFIAHMPERILENAQDFYALGKQSAENAIKNRDGIKSANIETIKRLKNKEVGNEI